MINRKWLFVCSCIALVTSAFTFSIRGDVLQEMGDSFQLTQAQKGGVEGAVFMGMALSMLVGGFICDALGMKNILILAFLSHVVGSLATIFAPHDPDITYIWLYGSSLLMGFGNGFTEVGINPLIATMYADKKTHYLNILHAWWPGGLMIGGLSAQFIVREYFKNGFPADGGGLAMWQVSMLLITLPAILYGIMLIPAKFPVTERVESGVTTGEMLSACARPLFIVWAVCMLGTAATELGPQKWQESVMKNTAGISGTQILVYTSCLMFILRHFAGTLAHAISPVGMMLGSATLSAIGLYLLSFASDKYTAFGFATIFGVGIAYFWPTMLGFTAERFPRGGALALALMGSAGNLSISQVLPQMGRIVDRYAVEHVETELGPEDEAKVLKKNDEGKPTGVDNDAVAAQVKKADASKASLPKEFQVAKDGQEVGYRMAFRWVSILPAVLVVIFGMIILYDKSQGGYKAQVQREREKMTAGSG